MCWWEVCPASQGRAACGAHRSKVIDGGTLPSGSRSPGQERQLHDGQGFNCRLRCLWAPRRPSTIATNWEVRQLLLQRIVPFSHKTYTVLAGRARNGMPTAATIGATYNTVQFSIAV